MAVARVYVGRLSNYARDRDVERFFKNFGRIKEIQVKNGYCFVVSVQLIICRCISSMAIVAIQHENLEIFLIVPGTDQEILRGGGSCVAGVSPSDIQGRASAGELRG